MILKSGPICGSIEESLPKKAETPLGVRIDKDHIQLQEMGNLKKKKNSILNRLEALFSSYMYPLGKHFKKIRTKCL